MRKCVDSIDRATLESAITPLREASRAWLDLSVKYQQRVESLEQAEGEWHTAAERAKHQLEVWAKWAYDTEVERRQKIFPWASEFLALNLSLDLRGWWRSVLSSPQKMRANLAFFTGKLGALEKIISTAYIGEKLPVNLSNSEFDEIIRNLMDCQAKVDALSAEVSRAGEELGGFEKSYFSLEEPLVRLLWSMPEASHWALFRICRADLQERFDAEPPSLLQSS